jgi:hypothetical protein
MPATPITTASHAEHVVPSWLTGFDVFQFDGVEAGLQAGPDITASR